MTKLVVMVGLPGSGKSTEARRLCDSLDAVIFSSDEYRLRLLGDESRQAGNQLVFERLYEDLVDCLARGKSVILDATNITVKDRKSVMNRVSKIDCDRIAYVVATPIDVCLERNKNRSRVVPNDVILRMQKRFQFPMYYEGFNSIVVHTMNDVIGFSDLIKNMDKMDGFNQMNPHHKYDLLEHSTILANHYDKAKPEYFAGIVHDIGKLFTQTIDDRGIAHYFSHDSIGAYYLATVFPAVCFMIESLGVEEDKLLESSYEVLFFVNWHMSAHSFSSEKSIHKYTDLFGEDLFNRLMLFAEYDRIASGTAK